MFFSRAKDARVQAQIDNVGLEKIGMKHVVKPTKRPLPPGQKILGKDFKTGFTLVLERL